MPSTRISIHTLREEGDKAHGRRGWTDDHFYPRPPRGGRLSTPSRGWKKSVISIHALREEGDRFHTACGCDPSYFYPRPPRGGRLATMMATKTNRQFLSTPSARRATKKRKFSIKKAKFLSTPSTRRATETYPTGGSAVYISIHALREEGDSMKLLGFRRATVFLSTPSARRATWTGKRKSKATQIFLSTPSARRATSSGRLWWLRLVYFYPRPPRGGRLPFSKRIAPPSQISIHALREEGDQSPLPGS